MKKTPKRYVGSSPMKAVWIPAAITAGVGLLNFFSGQSSKKKAAAARRRAEAAAAPYLEAYKNYEFKNPYENMENVYEDARVSTQAAEFQRQHQAQQQANIMQGLSGAAGSAGVASLAQAMARTGAKQAEKMSAGIALQEQKIEAARLKEQSRIQGLQQYGAQMVEQQNLQRDMNLYRIEAGKAGLAAQQFAAGQKQMMGGVGQIASAGLQAYSAGVFDGTETTTTTTGDTSTQPDIYTIPDANYTYDPLETSTYGMPQETEINVTGGNTPSYLNTTYNIPGGGYNQE